jgi:hypothetical protein
MSHYLPPLVLFLITLFGWQGPAVLADPPKTDPAPPDGVEMSTPRGDSAAPEPRWLLPWKEHVTYEFAWYLSVDSSRKDSGEPDGRTTFTLTWNKNKTGIECPADLDLNQQGSLLKMSFFTIFNLELKPAFYVSRVIKETTGGAAGGGSAGVVAAFREKDISVRLGTNKNQKTEHIPRPTDPFWLYGHQAIQHWAVFLAFLDPAKPSSVKVFMPDILRFITITFSPEGPEEIRGMTATRLAFNAEGLFSGRVWLGPDRRLLRYEQRLPNGSLNIWIQEKAKSR